LSITKSDTMKTPLGLSDSNDPEVAKTQRTKLQTYFTNSTYPLTKYSAFT